MIALIVDLIGLMIVEYRLHLQTAKSIAESVAVLLFVLLTTLEVGTRDSGGKELYVRWGIRSFTERGNICEGEVGGAMDPHVSITVAS